MSTVYTLPTDTGHTVRVVALDGPDPDPGAYTVYLDALGVASLAYQLTTAGADVGVAHGAEHESVVVAMTPADGPAVPLGVAAPLDVDGVTLWDLGSVGLEWQGGAVLAHAADVSVDGDEDEGDPWVTVAVHDPDGTDEGGPVAYVTLTAREAHELAADIIVAARSAEAAADLDE